MTRDDHDMTSDPEADAASAGRPVGSEGRNASGGGNANKTERQTDTETDTDLPQAADVLSGLDRVTGHPMGDSSK